MYLMNLDKLKIDKTGKADMFNYSIDWASIENEPLSFQYRAIKNAIEDFVNHPSAFPAFYRIDFEDSREETDEDESIFQSIVNVTLAVFFELMCYSNQGRPRERRLDVPDKLKCIKCSMSLIKRAINHKTVRDSFNLCICYKGYEYYLCDERERIEKEEFVHNTDELKGGEPSDGE